MSYAPKVFPGVSADVGIRDILAITVVVLDEEDEPTTNNVTPIANLAAFNAAYAVAHDLDAEPEDIAAAELLLEKHALFAAIVNHFSPYANPVSISATGNTVTLGFEQAGLFSNAGIGRPGNFTENGNPRANAFDLAATFLTSTPPTVATFEVSACTVTINGVAQTTTNQ